MKHTWMRGSRASTSAGLRLRKTGPSMARPPGVRMPQSCRFTTERCVSGEDALVWGRGGGGESVKRMKSEMCVRRYVPWR